MPDIYDDSPSPSEVAELLSRVDQDKANELVAAFDGAATRLHAQIAEAMWALAMLQARVLATAPMGPVQVTTAAHMADMVRIALPGMMLAIERGRREATGEQPFDA